MEILILIKDPMSMVNLKANWTLKETNCVRLKKRGTTTFNLTWCLLTILNSTIYEP